jgi:hypothetical protein
MRSASATSRLITRSNSRLCSGPVAVFNSEAIASSFRCTSAKSSLGICKESIEYNPGMQSVEISECSVLNFYQIETLGMIGSASEKVTAMPEWILSCQNCKRMFMYSKIEPQADALLYDPLWPYRPEVPEGGLKAVCPHCQLCGLYQRFQLKLSSTDAAYIQ